MARGEVRIPVVVDPSGVKRGTAVAAAELSSFDRRANKSTKTLSSLTTVAGGAGLALGGGLALGLSQSISAFKDAEKQTSRYVAQLKVLGVNTEAVRKQVEDVTAAQSKLSGFTKTELTGSFATLLTSTGNVTDALKLNATTMDFARLRHLPLEQAAKILGKVWDGNVATLNRYGIRVAKGTTATEALRLVQQKAAGQAKSFGDTTAGAADKAGAKIELLKEKVGAGLAPAMNDAASATVSFADATGTLIDRAGGLGPIVAGAAGFGAFRLLAPSLHDAGSAVGALSKVAGEKGAGTSMRVLGSAVADSVSPMTAAGIGAGLLAAGIYEIYSNSETADQAVSGLNATIKGLNSALDQTKVAKDAVNNAKDYVKSTGDAEKAGRARASALHAEVVQLQEHKGTVAQVAAADKRWQKALSDVVPLVHQHKSAVDSLDAAQKNLTQSEDGATEAADKQNRKARDVTNKIRDQVTIVRAAGKSAVILSDGLGGAGAEAEKFAALMDKAAASTHGTDRAVSTADSNLAGFARHIGRLPTIREIKLVTHYTAEGLSLDELEKKIDSLHSKAITLTTTVNPLTGRVVAPKVTPKRTGPPFNPSASGAYVAGSYSAGDRVPAMLSGEEVVLNPAQQGMVASGWSIGGALRATGAPTIGYATGAGARGGNAPRLPGGPRGGSASVAGARSDIAQKVVAALNSQQARWGSSQALAALGISRSNAFDDPVAQAAALTADQLEAQRESVTISQILANPAKALRVKGGVLTRDQRTSLLQALASATDRAVSDRDSAYALLHPDATSGSSGSNTAADTSTTIADLQAQLAQANDRGAIATRAKILSDTTLSALGARGDIGGGFGTVRDAGAGITINTLHPGDSRTLAAVAAAAAAGFGQQASVGSKRIGIYP